MSETTQTGEPLFSPEKWARIRRFSRSKQRAPEWPDGVDGISSEGLSLLGIHEKTDALYWDGKQVVVRSSIRLGTFERWIAAIATLGTFGTFIVEVGRSAKWWGG